MSDRLDKHLVFQFKFISKTKKVNNDFIIKLKELSKHTLRNLLFSGKTQAGYATIETNKSSLPEQLNDDFIEHISKTHNQIIEKNIIKYDYLRVGNKERIFGKLVDNTFYALIYDPDKKYIK